MAGRTPAVAVNNFLEPLQQTLDCVTNGVIDVSGGYYVRDEPHLATLNGGLPARLFTRYDPPLALTVKMHCRVVEATGARGPWKVQTAGWSYAIRSIEDDHGRELVSVHWHPSGASAVTWPHMHVRDELLSDTAEVFAGAHFPSGRVALEEVIRLLIEDLGVEPRRDDWEEVLGSNLERFENWRTWP